MPFLQQGRPLSRSLNQITGAKCPRMQSSSNRWIRMCPCTIDVACADPSLHSAGTPGNLFATVEIESKAAVLFWLACRRLFRCRYCNCYSANKRHVICLGHTDIPLRGSRNLHTCSWSKGGIMLGYKEMEHMVALGHQHARNDIAGREQLLHAGFKLTNSPGGRQSSQP